MSKFHINKKGVPAPCRATKGNCPFGGGEQHYNTQEEAQLAADEANEVSYGYFPKVSTMSDKDIARKGKELTNLIGKRKNSVKPPELREGGIKSDDDLYTLAELQGAFITKQEHDPVENAKDMFDHVAGKSGKLYRYGSDGDSPLETHDYDFDGVMRRHKTFLDDDGILEDYNDEDFKDSFGGTPEDMYKADLENHRKLYDYSREIAVEYGKDFEQKVGLNDSYNQEDRDKLQAEYRKAVSDKIGSYIEGYGRD